MISQLSSWLIFLLVSGLTTALILTIVLAHRERTRWMRIFCAKLEIPRTTMEGEAPPPMVTVPSPDNRRRIRVPVPGANIYSNGNR